MTDDLLLLGLLFGSSMHGYGLNEMAERLRPFGWHVKPSSVYGRLERLERTGLVESHSERVGRRPERKVYALTEAGTERFHELLRENLRSGERVAGPGELGLLFLGVLPAEEAAALLSERRDAMLEDRDGVETLAQENAPGLLAAEHALAMIEAEIEWLTQALDRSPFGAC